MSASRRPASPVQSENDDLRRIAPRARHLPVLARVGDAVGLRLRRPCSAARRRRRPPSVRPRALCFCPPVPAAPRWTYAVTLKTPRVPALHLSASSPFCASAARPCRSPVAGGRASPAVEAEIDFCTSASPPSGCGQCVLDDDARACTSRSSRSPSVESSRNAQWTVPSCAIAEEELRVAREELDPRRAPSFWQSRSLSLERLERLVRRVLVDRAELLRRLASRRGGRARGGPRGEAPRGSGGGGAAARHDAERGERERARA